MLPETLDAADFEPGDLLLFAGADLESKLIALATCSLAQLLAGEWYSHIGVVANHGVSRLLFESTTKCATPCWLQRRQVSGPQAHPPASRVSGYDGAVYRLRLASRLRVTGDDGWRLGQFLRSKLGERYDFEGAAVCATHLLRLARWLRPSLDKLFCSAYALEALKSIGRVDEDLPAQAYSPARAARDLMYWGTYQPLGADGSESVRLK